MYHWLRAVFRKKIGGGGGGGWNIGPVAEGHSKGEGGGPGGVCHLLRGAEDSTSEW